MSSLLEAKGLYGGYGGADILKGTDLRVESDEIVVIVGPNGAGKSTAMKAVFGLLRIRQGQILYHGEAITNSKPEPEEIDLERLVLHRPFHHPPLPVLTIEHRGS